jgi:hypothetical protein
MSGLKRAVFVSYLHLGSNPTLDDFTRDREFRIQYTCNPSFGIEGISYGCWLVPR